MIEEDRTLLSPIERLRAAEVHWVRVAHPTIGRIRAMHSGAYADCLICIPRTSGCSLPNYRR